MASSGSKRAPRQKVKESYDSEDSEDGFLDTCEVVDPATGEVCLVKYRGVDPAMASGTSAWKKEKRLADNRASAARSRMLERLKKTALERQIELLGAENRRLAGENARLNAALCGNGGLRKVHAAADLRSQASRITSSTDSVSSSSPASMTLSFPEMVPSMDLDSSSVYSTALTGTDPGAGVSSVEDASPGSVRTSPSRSACVDPTPCSPPFLSSLLEICEEEDLGLGLHKSSMEGMGVGINMGRGPTRSQVDFGLDFEGGRDTDAGLGLRLPSPHLPSMLGGSPRVMGASLLSLPSPHPFGMGMDLDMDAMEGLPEPVLGTASAASGPMCLSPTCRPKKRSLSFGSTAFDAVSIMSGPMGKDASGQEDGDGEETASASAGSMHSDGLSAGRSSPASSSVRSLPTHGHPHGSGHGARTPVGRKRARRGSGSTRSSHSSAGGAASLPLPASLALCLGMALCLTIAPSPDTLPGASSSTTRGRGGAMPQSGTSSSSRFLPADMDDIGHSDGGAGRGGGEYRSEYARAHFLQDPRTHSYVAAHGEVGIDGEGEEAEEEVTAVCADRSALSAGTASSGPVSASPASAGAAAPLTTLPGSSTRTGPRMDVTASFARAAFASASKLLQGLAAVGTPPTPLGALLARPAPRTMFPSSTTTSTSSTMSALAITDPWDSTPWPMTRPVCTTCGYHQSTPHDEANAVAGLPIPVALHTPNAITYGLHGLLCGQQGMTCPVQALPDPRPTAAALQAELALAMPSLAIHASKTGVDPSLVLHLAGQARAGLSIAQGHGYGGAGGAMDEEEEEEAEVRGQAARAAACLALLLAASGLTDSEGRGNREEDGERDCYSDAESGESHRRKSARVHSTQAIVGQA